MNYKLKAKNNVPSQLSFIGSLIQLAKANVKNFLIR